MEQNIKVKNINNGQINGVIGVIIVTIIFVIIAIDNNTHSYLIDGKLKAVKAYVLFNNDESLDVENKSNTDINISFLAGTVYTNNGEKYDLESRNVLIKANSTGTITFWFEDGVIPDSTVISRLQLTHIICTEDDQNINNYINVSVNNN